MVQARGLNQAGELPAAGFSPMPTTRRQFLTGLTAGLTGLALRETSPAERPPQATAPSDGRPHRRGGWQDYGCCVSGSIRTPRTDRLAADSMRLTSFYAQAVCGPSRAALMTGCYPIRVGEPGNRKDQHTLPHPQEVTIAEVLHNAGYATACIGKWHLGSPTKAGGIRPPCRTGGGPTTTTARRSTTASQSGTPTPGSAARSSATGSSWSTRWRAGTPSRETTPGRPCGSAESLRSGRAAARPQDGHAGGWGTGAMHRPLARSHASGCGR
jgi:hypothetical protein